MQSFAIIVNKNKLQGLVLGLRLSAIVNNGEGFSVCDCCQGNSFSFTIYHALRLFDLLNFLNIFLVDHNLAV